MIIDGKSIAQDIYDELTDEIRTTGITPRLGIITCAPNFETQKYLALKKRKAEEVGVHIEVVEFPEMSTTEELIAAVGQLGARTHGVLVQLPLPAHIDTAAVVASVPISHDVDALNPDTTETLSPVVGAITEILKVHEVPIFECHVTIIGNGKLVGLPAARWFTEHGAAVSVITKDTEDIAYYTKAADIIVCGAGSPGVLKPDMIKEGVVILDAGTTEDSGELRGDADPLCAEKATLFTPVPGGIGPITVAVLLRNVLTLAKRV